MEIEGYVVHAPDYLHDLEYDKIIIGSYPGLNPITKQLLGMGVDFKKIDSEFVLVSEKSRILFLERLSELFQAENITGCVAEGGVFQGEFAKEINRVFCNSDLYLFDTFTGFDERDVLVELNKSYSNSSAGHLNITGEDIVLGKLPYPKKCIMRKGYFPDTAKDIEQTFCFVNLDFDLYNPTLAGLQYFYPRMVSGGVILVHDYFIDGYKGVIEAVKEFEKDRKLNKFPIGDGVSIGILC